MRTKYVAWSVRPSSSCTKPRRISSPSPGRSILITRAPRSASSRVQYGPASTRVKSSTVRSSRSAVTGPYHTTRAGTVSRRMAARVTVVWFRRDLRLADHPALEAAVASGAAVVPLFVVDPRLMTGRDAPREAWLRAALGALAAELHAAGVPLVVRRGDPREEVPRAAREVGAHAVHWSDDFTPYARRRDGA